MADLRAVYAAVDEAAALDALDTFSERWDKIYPKIAPSNQTDILAWVGKYVRNTRSATLCALYLNRNSLTRNVVRTHSIDSRARPPITRRTRLPQRHSG